MIFERIIWCSISKYNNQLIIISISISRNPDPIHKPLNFGNFLHILNGVTLWTMEWKSILISVMSWIKQYCNIFSLIAFLVVRHLFQKVLRTLFSSQNTAPPALCICLMLVQLNNFTPIANVPWVHFDVVPTKLFYLVKKIPKIVFNRAVVFRMTIDFEWCRTV